MTKNRAKKARKAGGNNTAATAATTTAADRQAPPQPIPTTTTPPFNTDTDGYTTVQPRRTRDHASSKALAAAAAQQQQQQLHLDSSSSSTSQIPTVPARPAPTSNRPNVTNTSSQGQTDRPLSIPLSQAATLAAKSQSNLPNQTNNIDGTRTTTTVRLMFYLSQQAKSIKQQQQTDKHQANSNHIDMAVENRAMFASGSVRLSQQARLLPFRTGPTATTHNHLQLAHMLDQAGLKLPMLPINEQEMINRIHNVNHNSEQKNQNKMQDIDCAVSFNPQQYQQYQQQSANNRLRLQLGIDSISRCTTVNNGRKAYVSFSCRSPSIANTIRSFCNQQSGSRSSASSSALPVDAACLSTGGEAGDSHAPSIGSAGAASATAAAVNNNRSGFVFSIIQPAVDLIPIVIRGISAAVFGNPFEEAMDKRRYIFCDPRIQHLHFGTSTSKYSSNNNIPAGLDMRDVLAADINYWYDSRIGIECWVEREHIGELLILEDLFKQYTRTQRLLMTTILHGKQCCSYCWQPGHSANRCSVWKERSASVEHKMSENGDELDRRTSAACTRCLLFHHDVHSCNKPQAACTLCGSREHIVPRCPQYRLQYVPVDRAFIQQQMRVARVKQPAPLPPPIFTDATYPRLPAWGRGNSNSSSNTSSPSSSNPSSNSPSSASSLPGSPSSSGPTATTAPSSPASIANLDATIQSMAASMGTDDS